MVSEVVTIKPDLRIHHPEYGDLTEDVARELALLRQEEHARLYRNAARQQAALVRARPGEAVRHDTYRLKAELDPQVHAYWRMREGPGFWKHELDWFLKRHPECAVPTVAAAPAVRVDGLRGRPRLGRRGRWAL